MDEGSDQQAPQQPFPKERLVARPGFAWGLAFGSLAAVAIIAIALVTVQVAAISRFRGPSAAGSVTVTATKAGKQWFSASSGKGTIQGWIGGSSGSGDGPAGTAGYFELAALDSVDGVTIKHSLPVYLSKNTQLIVGGQRYGKPVSSLFSDQSDGPGGILYGRLLTIEFHTDGSLLVADRIETSLESSASPLQSW